MYKFLINPFNRMVFSGDPGVGQEHLWAHVCELCTTVWILDLFCYV